MKVSAVLAIHNRSHLLERALKGYLWQTMPRQDWEIVLVDDMSTEDLSKTYQHLKGVINLRHVKIDHTRHPVWKERNPGGAEDGFENWYHTPAITINLGCHLAKGDIICLCHPEILHAPTNFEKAFERMAVVQNFLFGKTYLGTRSHNVWLDKNVPWTAYGWKKFIENVRGYDSLGAFGPTELYWYTSFLPRKAVEAVGGVDFIYLNGAAGEDDDFKERVSRAGCSPLWYPALEGFHQNHDDEKEKHRDRTSEKWRLGLHHNRQVFFSRMKHNTFPFPANQDYDWTGKECFLEETGISYEAH